MAGTLSDNDGSRVRQWLLVCRQAQGFGRSAFRAAKLRKDELRTGIVAFLPGAAKLPTKRALRKTGMKDLERGLTLNLRIEHYTSNHET
jgi:hypothetical protein